MHRAGTLVIYINARLKNEQELTLGQKAIPREEKLSSQNVGF